MTTGSVLVKLDYHDVTCSRNYLIMATGSVPVRLPPILLSLLAQTNTNTKWCTNFVFAKEFTKYLFRLLTNLYIQTKHHPVAASKWGGGGRKNPKLIHFYKQGCAHIHYSCTCDRILIFTNRLQVSLVNTFYCSF